MGTFKDAILATPKITMSATEKVELTCAIHGKFSGFQTKVNGKKINSDCPSCLEKAEAEARLKRNHETRLRENSNIFSQSCIPKAYQNKSLKSWETRCKAAVELKALMGRYVMEFETVQKRGTSFLFSGGTRTGKTHLATAVANNVMRRGFTAVYISSLNYISKMKRSWTAGSTISEDEVVESFMKYDLLVFDELGKQNNPNEKAMIFRLLDRRAEEKLPVLGVTKYSDTQLAKLIDDDAVSRLVRGGGRVIKFNWSNYEDQEERF